MKVGILTFHASHNYGSMLQAFALQTTLTKLGIDNIIINYRSDIQKSLIPPPIEFRHPRSSLLKLLREPSKALALMKKYHRFEQFLSRDLNVTEELTTKEAVAQHVSHNQYDAIITGSDQIWNPACWDFSTVYLCNFPFEGKRIAYAPSLGAHPEEITGEEGAQLVKLIAKYDSLSTREKRGKDFLASMLDKPVDVVLDPTLLLDAKEYESITSHETIDQPYILYYTPREEKGHFKSALDLSRQLDMPVVVTQDFSEYDGHDNVIFKLDCGPKEFLSLIKNATYCIGNSFHLLAFSLIFRKEFLLLSREQDSRMLSILDSLSLQERLLRQGGDIVLNEKINYAYIYDILAEIKHNSKVFINKTLEF